MNWFSLIQVAIMAALSASTKTAPIANEVAAGVTEAEQLFTAPGSGPAKLEHVLNIAKDAAQAVDELKGGADDVLGPVSVAVATSIAATNAIIKALKGTSTPPAGV